VTTLDDFYRWFSAIRGNLLLDESHTATLFTPDVLERESLWATPGWNLTVTESGDTVLFHAGDLGGYNAECRWDRTRDILVIFFSNTRPHLSGVREAVMPRAIALWLGLDHDLPPLTVPYNRSVAIRDTGTFALPSGARISVKAGTTALEVVGDGQDAFTWLAGSSPSDTGLATITARAEALTTALQRSDTAGLAAALHASPMAAPALSAAFAAWHAMADSMGPVSAVRLVGTVIGVGLDARTAIRVTHARGEQVLVLGWRSGQLASVAQQDSVESIRFLPERAGRDTYVSYDVFTGRTIRLVFAVAGQPPVLRIESGGSVTTAERQSTGPVQR
jgi:hypothetical protein